MAQVWYGDKDGITVTGLGRGDSPEEGRAAGTPECSPQHSEVTDAGVRGPQGHVSPWRQVCLHDCGYSRLQLCRVASP